ncbi:2-dehydro-3-deoxy-D-gluconate 5-dehydrogenase KduD [Marinobacterium rhizophilum]|uniref:2-dehydro-3-deoxy-D-gluconate 5-dehydrogenase KduD n=2 Tax=Gammaproteobacteria TaxID=1236 RepID=A0ABY5HKC8_9GAMM|nr:2-dehydro-3-deoxy-D-gluconate 5-dehydrogenase KduD [Marinobacterium rhizophilum]UTW12579.1 2-dehydro-3-deoxy-D-gluconate 5-dehydrogenase KduD [Marinobacterium rhizophilum]
MILNAFDLHDKVAIVTGCNTGLGQGMAVGLAQAGCHIVGVNRSDATETRTLIESLGRRFLGLQADLGNTDELPAIIDSTVSEFGKVDVLINNAGIIRRNDAIDFSTQDWDDVMDVNLRTTFFMSQAVARRFIAQGSGGKIINIASMLSYQGGIRVPSYTASKSGVLGITRLMANEWAAQRINVNAIAPGYMSTNNTEALRTDEQRSQEILARIPAQRWGLPEDMMGSVVFLASRASDYVNGHSLAVDGGWLAR